MNDLAIAHEELELAGALTAITDELCTRVQLTITEIELLSRHAALLRTQAEECWERLRRLMADHDTRLRTFFPGIIPDNCQLVFETLTGADKADEAFAQLMHLIQNAVPNYPDSLRGEPGPSACDQDHLDE